MIYRWLRTFYSLFKKFEHFKNITGKCFWSSLKRRGAVGWKMRVFTHIYGLTKGKAFNQIYTIYTWESSIISQKKGILRRRRVAFKRDKNQEEGTWLGNLFINNLKTAYSVAEVGWDVGQKLDWEASENKW